MQFFFVPEKSANLKIPVNFKKKQYVQKKKQNKTKTKTGKLKTIKHTKKKKTLPDETSWFKPALALLVPALHRDRIFPRTTLDQCFVSVVTEFVIDARENKNVAVNLCFKKFQNFIHIFINIVFHKIIFQGTRTALKMVPPVIAWLVTAA